MDIFKRLFSIKIDARPKKFRRPETFTEKICLLMIGEATINSKVRARNIAKEPGFKKA